MIAVDSNLLVYAHRADSEWHEPALRRLVSAGRVAGGLVHDARVAAICLHNGISTLWTADRDFSRFPELKTLNPPVRAKK